MNMARIDDEVARLQTSLLEHLSEIGQEITAHLDAGAVYQVLNRHLHGLLDINVFAIYLADPAGLNLACAFCLEYGNAVQKSPIPVSHPNCHAARCWRDRSKILLDHEPPRTHIPATARADCMSSLYLPMISGERTIGVMMIQSPLRHAFGERERLIFRTLCAYGTIALANSATCHQLESALAALHETRGLLAKAANEQMMAEQLGRQRAEEATRLKSEFLANMSHEIRNPMNAIIGMAHLALRTDLNSRQQDYVTKIHRAGLSLLGLINDILDFSKIEAGKLEMEAIPFFLDEVLNNVASVTSQRAAEKQLEYLFNVPPQVPRHLLGDSLRLSQVLINLVNNAIKFTEKGEIELAISALNEAGPVAGTGDKVRLNIAIRDTGIGMTPEQLARLFQPFSQAEDSTTRKYGGTGLGLSISQHLVEMMHGKIAIRTEAGQGSTFFFELELALADECEPPPRLPSDLPGSRVLVVDDNPQALACMQLALQALPLQVDTAASGIAALRAMIAADQAGEPYAMVLADWHMPKMDGIELQRRIAERPQVAGGMPPLMPKVVLMAAFGREDDLPDLAQSGFAALLFKPVTQSTLRSTLSGLFAPQQSGTPARTTPQHAFTGASVLLAEDNDINQQIAIELLGTVGIRVDVANTGVEAVNKLLCAGEQGYSAILMDLEMPEMNGHDATLRIRSEARFNDVPIIAMTAHALADVREQCVREGMQDYLTKPIHPELLYQTLARWIK